MTSRNERHSDTWDVLKQWTKSQHQRVSRFYNPETVVQLFDRLEKTQQQLHFAVQEKNTLAGQNMRMKQQIENFEAQFGLSNATIRQLRTELAAKSEAVDSLRIELREHQLTFHTASNELQNITVRRSRFDDTVSQSTKRGGTDARNKTLIKSRVRCCPSPGSPLRMPSEKRAKQMSSELEEDDDRLNVGPTLTPRRKPLLPPPLVITPLTHYCPRRSVSEPRPAPATPKFAPYQEQQQHHHPQRTDGVEESNEKYDNFGPITTTTNFCCHPPGRMLMPPVHMTNSGGGTALGFSSYASTSSISSTPLLGGGFSADSSSMLGPVTWTQSGEGAAQHQQKSSWMAKRVRKGGALFARPY